MVLTMCMKQNVELSELFNVFLLREKCVSIAKVYSIITFALRDKGDPSKFERMKTGGEGFVLKRTLTNNLF